MPILHTRVASNTRPLNWIPQKLQKHANQIFSCSSSLLFLQPSPIPGRFPCQAFEPAKQRIPLLWSVLLTRMEAPPPCHPAGTKKDGGAGKRAPHSPLKSSWEAGASPQHKRQGQSGGGGTKRGVREGENTNAPSEGRDKEEWARTTGLGKASARLPHTTGAGMHQNY